MLTSHDPSTFLREWEARGLHGTVADSLSQGSSPRGPTLPDTGRSLGEQQQQQQKSYTQQDSAEPSRPPYQPSMLGVQQPQQQQPQPGSQQPQVDAPRAAAVFPAQQNVPAIPSQSNAAADRHVNTVQQGSATREANARPQDVAQASMQRGSGNQILQDRAQQGPVQKGMGRMTAGPETAQLGMSVPNAQAAGQVWQVQAPASPRAQPAGSGKQQPGLAALSASGPASGAAMRGAKAGSGSAPADASSGRQEASMRPDGHALVVPGARTAAAPSTKPGPQLKEAAQPSGVLSRPPLITHKSALGTSAGTMSVHCISVVYVHKWECAATGQQGQCPTPNYL